MHHVGYLPRVELLQSTVVILNILNHGNQKESVQTHTYNISLHLKWCRNCRRNNLPSTNRERCHYYTIPRTSFWKIKICYWHLILHLLSRGLNLLFLQPATCPGYSSNATSVTSYSKTRVMLIEAVQLELCTEILLASKTNRKWRLNHH